MGSKYTKVLSFIDKQNIKGLYEDDTNNYFWRYNEDYTPVNVTSYIDRNCEYYNIHKGFFNTDKWEQLPNNIKPTYKLRLPEFGDNYILDNSDKTKNTIVFKIELTGINSTVIFVCI